MATVQSETLSSVPSGCRKSWHAASVSTSKMSYCTSDDLVHSVLTSSQIDELPIISRTGYSKMLAYSCSAHEYDCRNTFQSHIELLAHPAAELDSDQRIYTKVRYSGDTFSTGSDMTSAILATTASVTIDLASSALSTNDS